MAYMISHVTGNKTATAHPYSALYVLRERTQQHKNANSYLEGFYLNHQWGLSFSLASVKIPNHSICFSVHAIFFVLSQERSPNSWLLQFCFILCTGKECKTGTSGWALNAWSFLLNLLCTVYIPFLFLAHLLARRNSPKWLPTACTQWQPLTLTPVVEQRHSHYQQTVPKEKGLLKQIWGVTEVASGLRNVE